MLAIAGIGSLGAATEAFGAWNGDDLSPRVAPCLQYASVITLLALGAWGASRSDAPGGALGVTAAAGIFVAFPLARRFEYIGDQLDRPALFVLKATSLFFAIAAAHAHDCTCAWALPACNAATLVASFFFAS
jgi:hypothetical protein